MGLPTARVAAANFDKFHPSARRPRRLLIAVFVLRRRLPHARWMRRLLCVGLLVSDRKKERVLPCALLDEGSFSSRLKARG